MSPLRSNRSGFTLIQTALSLAVIGILLAASLPGGTKTFQPTKYTVTMERLEAIEDAMKGFMTREARRPCPADGTLTTVHANFGVEANNPNTPGTCRGGAVEANWHDNGVAAGIVPIRTLGLPDEYALDGWGRRFMYLVDTNATKSGDDDTDECSYPNNLRGAIRVQDENNSIVNVKVAYISYGPDGQGAFPSEGSAVGSRFDAGVTDASTLSNAFDSGVPNPVIMAVQINLSSLNIPPAVYYDDSDFDDIVYAKTNPTSRLCCLGATCPTPFP